MKRKQKTLTKMLLFVVFSTFAFTSNANHFRYGNIGWEPVQGKTNTIKFTYKSAWRASYANRSVGQLVSLGGFYFGGTTNLGTSTALIATVTSVNTLDDLMYCEWTKTVTYTSAGDFNAFYRSCCRISTLKNNGSKGFRQGTIVNVGSGNRPPSTNVPPIINMTTNLKTAKIQIPGYDPDGDTIKYRLATSLEASGTSSGFVQPTNLSISNTGVLSFNTTGLAVGSLYNTSIVLADKSTIIMVDLIIRIVGNSSPPKFDYSVTPANSYNIRVTPLQNVNFLIRASDEDSSQTFGGDVKIQAIGAPVGATFSPTLPTKPGHVTQTTFNWTPSIYDLGDYVISFYARDDLGVQTLTSVTISVSYKPIFNGLTPSNYSRLCVKNGDSLTYIVQTKDLDVNGSVRIKSIGIQSPASSFAAGFPVKTTLPPNFSVTNSVPTAYGKQVSTNLNWGVKSSDWGIYEVEFTAEDRYLDKSVLTHYYLVDEAPIFTSTPITIATVNQMYSYTIIVTDADTAYGDSIYISDYRSTYPSWLTLVDNGDGTATLSGTPSTSDIGQHSLRIESHDRTTHYRHTHCTQKFQDFNIQVMSSCALVLSSSVINEDCPNAKDGSIDLTLTGANGTPNYLWSNSITTEDLSGLSPGVYSVTISDALGCKKNASYTIFAGIDVIAPNVITKDITVYLDAAGIASITASDLDNGTTDNCGVAFTISNSNFDCSHVGTNKVVFTALDPNGNSALDTAVVTVMDTIAPKAMCKDISVTLVNGVATISASDIDNGSSDACGMNLSVNMSSFTCAHIGANPVTLTVTDNNNNSSTCNATVTVIGSIPTVEITNGLLPPFCQGNVIKLSTTTTNGNSISYVWNTTETTSSILAPTSGTYSVNISNEYGCTAVDSISIAFITDTLLSAHTLIATKDINLQDKTNVQTGGVSALGSSGKISVLQGSSIVGTTTFAKAKTIDTKNTTITNEIKSIASVNLPSFKYNPNCNSNNVTIASNKTVTLNDSIYGEIKIGKNSTVTFTSPVLYIKQLSTSKEDTILFTASCVNMYVCKKVSLKQDNEINRTDKSLVIYVEEDFIISQNSTFNGSVYSLKNLKTNGQLNKVTAMKGLFIAENIVSRNTSWNWNTNCRSCVSSRRSNSITTSDDNAFIDANSVSVNLYPNPSNGVFSIDIFSPEDGNVNVTIYDVYGRLVYTTGSTTLTGPKQIEMDLSKLSKGTYLAVVQVNDTLVNKKVIKR